MHPAVKAGCHPLAVGVLGCSDIARRKFLPALLRSGSARLVAVASQSPETLGTRLPGVVAEYHDYTALLERDDIDLVYLSLPNHLHEEWTIRALRAGKHVLCEKPLGLDSQQVARMVEVARKHRLLLYENLMYLQHPQHTAVKELLSTQRLGPVHSLRAVFTIPALSSENFRNDEIRGGGAFHDLARYPLSVASYYLKGMTYEFCGYARQQDGVIISMQGVGRNEQDELLEFSIGFGLPYQSFYEVTTRRGLIRVDRAFTTPADLANHILVTCDGQDNSFVVPPADHFLLTIEQVCTLIRKPAAYRGCYNSNLNLACLADKLYRSCHVR